MTAPIALQLYTLREAMAEQGFEKMVRLVADMGYVGVEPAGFPGTTPEAAGKLFQELGLAVPSAHVALPIGDSKQQVLDTMAAIGSTCIVSGKGPADFETVDATKATCELFNEASANAKAAGMQFGIHNHWWEYLKVGDRYAYEIMLDLLDPDITFEIDTYWVQVAGPNPAEIVSLMGARSPLLHIKDGPAVKQEPMMPIGSGVLDWPSIVKAGGSHTEWLIVELDRCAIDMVEAVQQSYTYLVGGGLARGNK
ncbi:MAG: sugar phosphate isomerase/epimerase [Anaerolineae bacterium]|nr:sugar phosphate isomerase/epimerase [Anaerolineae bacterium]